MRPPIRELLLSAALLCAVSARGDAQAQTPTPEGPTTLRLTVPNFVPVTDAMLRPIVLRDLGEVSLLRVVLAV